MVARRSFLTFLLVVVVLLVSFQAQHTSSFTTYHRKQRYLCHGVHCSNNSPRSIHSVLSLSSRVIDMLKLQKRKQYDDDFFRKSSYKNRNTRLRNQVSLYTTADGKTTESAGLSVLPRNKNETGNTNRTMNQIVQQLLECIKQHESNNDNLLARNRSSMIDEYICSLESLFERTCSNETLIINQELLYGLYDVTYVKPAIVGENPVGGKWTRNGSIAQSLFRTRSTYQHIVRPNTTGIGSLWVTPKNNNNKKQKNNPFATGTTTSFENTGSTTAISSNDTADNNNSTTIVKFPVIGEAVNVVSLDAFRGLFRIIIILRGDAIFITNDERKNASSINRILSPLCVRVLFDSPRIIVLGGRGKNTGTCYNDNEPKQVCYINVNIGPKSSVVLDTSYIDHSIRIGVGARSGTRFIFQRIIQQQFQPTPDNDAAVAEANEYQWLLQKTPWKKSKLLIALFSIVATSIIGASRTNPFGSALARVGSGFVGTVALAISVLIAFSSGGIDQDDQSVRQRQSFERRLQTIKL